MRPRTLAALAGLAAMFALLGGSTAASGAQTSLFPDLSTAAAIDSYLVSKGIDPATVVKQSGRKNYAGAACPGAGWTCTASTRVVQVAPAGGKNVADCVGGGSCVVLQIAAAGPSSSSANNVAHCKKRDTGDDQAQSCDDIDQLGPRNHAFVDERITSTGGPEQDATQTAHVKQEGVFNASDIHQDVRQSTSAPGDQKQDVHQRADVEQSVSANGENFSHVHQAHDQNESGVALTQSQNTEVNPLLDCADDKVPNPNQCVNVSQVADGGKNASHLHQMIGERQTSTSATTQTQGRNDGGQEGDVHQQNPLPSGENIDFPHQDIRQWQSSATGIHPIQIQATDPGCCGVGTQIGGTKNIEFIHQATTQSSTEPNASQSATLFGQIHQVNDPANSCRIEQHGRNNSDAGHFSAEGDSAAGCFDLELATVCTSSGEGGSCQEVDPCTVNPACGDIVLLSFPSTPTFGQRIAMPDYKAEPSDFFPPSG
jgi:hypothetical protein